MADPQPGQPTDANITGVAIQTHIEYRHPGSFFDETTGTEVANRDPAAAAQLAPNSAFAFSYYDVVIVDVELDGHKVTCRSEGRNRSPSYFIGGQIFDRAAVAALNDDRLSTLLSNMDSNGYDRVIRCRTGNWQPFTDQDVQIRGTGSAVQAVSTDG